MQDQLTDRILKVIAKTQKLPDGKVSLDSSFEELNIDSMDGVNILFALENEFDITVPDEDAKKIRSIRDIVDGVTRLVEAKGAA
jgi:acyl carrier protein